MQTVAEQSRMCQRADYALGYAEYDVCRGVLKEGYKTLKLPMGRQVWIAINANKLTDKAKRRAFYIGIAAPAVKSLFASKTLDKVYEDTPPSYWFPAGERWGGGKQAVDNASTMVGKTFENTQGTCTALTARMYKYYLSGSGCAEPLKSAIEKQLQSCLGDKAKLLLTKELSDADFVIFRGQFDHIYEDAAQLILDHDKVLQDLKPGTTNRYQSKLASLSNGILVHGANDPNVASTLEDLQSILFDQAWLYPLYDEPYYVYYDPEQLEGEPQMNGRTGFVSLDRWGPKADSICEKTSSAASR
jgi:hypothetical protein